MTATLNDQTGRRKRPEPSAEAKAATELVRAAKEQGLSLTGPDGLPKQLTKTDLTVYLVDYGPVGSTAAPTVVTRGWTDPQNRTSVSRSAPLRSAPVREGKLNDYRWTLEPKDHVFPAGHRIGVAVFSSDQEYTLLPLGGTELRVAPHQSELRLPIVGGRPVLGF